MRHVSYSDLPKVAQLGDHLRASIPGHICLAQMPVPPKVAPQA